ncbi:MAG: uroporphyrinogen decarboxylase [Halodesulfurarchaeum sp.]
MKDLFLRAARGERTERPPVWLMRQAGRYLPEYREVRKEYTFREAISTPDVAEEITLQPFERFSPDGVVMYSDILVALEPLGLDYRIESGVGPVVMDPIEKPEQIPTDSYPIDESLDYVGILLERLQESVGDEAAVLGFAGGPFTLSSYAVAGEPSRSHIPVRRFRAKYPDAFAELLETFTDVVVEYLMFQVNHGADAIQLFDTYAGLLGPRDYREFVVPLHEQIVSSVDVPTIVFVRNMNGRLDLLQAAGADVVALDWTIEMDEARERLGPEVPVQGNLDPSYLLGDPDFVRERTREVIEQAGPTGHILNLGHGLDRRTPPENVAAFVETAKAFEW